MPVNSFGNLLQLLTATPPSQTSATDPATPPVSAPSPPGQPTPLVMPDYGAGMRWQEQWSKNAGDAPRPKGLGFLGGLVRPDGTGYMGEYSMDDEIDGRMIQFPSIVPTLSRKELQAILTQTKEKPMPTSVEDGIREKAMAYARQRLAAGLDPFAQPGEQNLDLFPDLPRAPDPPIRGYWYFPPDQAPTYRPLPDLPLVGR